MTRNLWDDVVYGMGSCPNMYEMKRGKYLGTVRGCGYLSIGVYYILFLYFHTGTYDLEHVQCSSKAHR